MIKKEKKTKMNETERYFSLIEKENVNKVTGLQQNSYLDDSLPLLFILYKEQMFLSREVQKAS